MPLPVQSVRAAPEHREILQAAAEFLRNGGAESLRAWLSDPTTRPVGPFRDEASALAFLRDRLALRLHPLEIWLFGSRARGDARADSDFDLLVVLPDTARDHELDPRVVAEPVIACGLGFDVVACRRSDFERERADPDTLAHRVVIEGRVVYQSRAARRSS